MYFSALVPLMLAVEEVAAGRRGQAYRKRAKTCLRTIRRAVTQQHKGINISHRVNLLNAQSLTLETTSIEAIREGYDQAIKMIPSLSIGHVSTCLDRFNSFKIGVHMVCPRIGSGSTPHSPFPWTLRARG
mmetsp:Transcript_26117/g.60667  ORF Transcript_26117/g.60667 Transcript_26117/m.60667 type:complete len:130 (+) Transcript_26117:772-1161(+)